MNRSRTCPEDGVGRLWLSLKSRCSGFCLELLSMLIFCGRIRGYRRGYRVFGDRRQTGLFSPILFPSNCLCSQ